MQVHSSPGGMNQVIKGQPDSVPPESLTVTRAKPKTKKERRGDCSSKSTLTAEQRRLNPMAGMDDEEEKKGAPAMTAEQRRLNPMAAAGGGNKPLTAEQKRLNPMAAMGGKGMANQVAKQAIANSMKRSVKKQDMTREFQQKSFLDSRDKIITLSKKSGLRGVNALEVARELRKKLRD